MTVEELNVIVSANAADFNRQMAQVNAQLGNLPNTTQGATGKTLGIFKKLAATVSALGIGKLISGALTDGGDLEQNLGGSEAVFKAYSATIQSTAKDAYKNVGLAETEYLATANKMGALFKGAGFDMASAADLTTAGMQRAADVASIMGISAKDAMEAVTGAAKGNFTMMDNLGVAINETNLKIYAQEKGLGELATTQDKVSAAMQMFLEKTEYAAGNYAKENDTYAGALNTLKAQVKNFSAEAGTAMLPLATSVLPLITEGLTAIRPAVLTVASLIGKVGGVVTSVADSIRNANPAQQNALKLALGMGIAIPAVTLATKGLALAKKGYSKIVELLTLKQHGFSAALKSTLGILGVVAAAIALFGIANNKTAKSLDDSEKKLNEEGKAADETADSVDEAAKSTDKMADAVERSTAGFDELNTLSGGSTFASGIVSEDDLDNVGNYSKELSDIMNTADNGNLLGFDTSGITDFFGELLSQIQSGDLKGAWDTLWNGFDGVMETVFGNGWTDFKGFWDNVGTSLSSGDWDKALYTLLTGFDNLMFELLGPTWTDFSDYWEGFGEKIGKGDWSGAFTQVGKDFTDGVSGVLGEIDKMFGWHTQEWYDDVVDFWIEAGAGLSQMFNGKALEQSELSTRYSTLQKDMNDAILRNMRLGLNTEEALQEAKRENIGFDADKAYYFDTYLAPKYYTDDVLNGYLSDIQNSGQVGFNPGDWYSTENMRRIYGYASGGFPDYGSLFLAGESGAEMVGTIGGRTAVVNNSQIETALYNAVKSAMQDGGGSERTVHITLELDGDVLDERQVRINNKNFRRFNGRA